MLTAQESKLRQGKNRKQAVLLFIIKTPQLHHNHREGAICISKNW